MKTVAYLRVINTNQARLYGAAISGMKKEGILRRRPCLWRRCPWIVFPLWVNCTADPIDSGRSSG